MCVLDRFQMLNADQPADPARIDRLFERDEIGRVTQHVADADDGLLFQCQIADGRALLFGRSDRFLEQEVVSRFQRLHGGSVVQVVGQADHDCIGEFRHLESFRPVVELVLFLDAMLFGHLLLAELVDVGHADHLHALGKSFGVRGIGVSPAAGAENDDGYGPVYLCFQPSDRTFEVFFVLCKSFRECCGSDGRSYDGESHQSQKFQSVHCSGFVVKNQVRLQI